MEMDVGVAGSLHEQHGPLVAGFRSACISPRGLNGDRLRPNETVSWKWMLVWLDPCMSNMIDLQMEKLLSLTRAARKGSWQVFEVLAYPHVD
ncbi:hypothetical protein CgunFtcFv8_008572 [Champsocephalus gunnari]|uniref:Uncharacterized protein n=1 Tax=Champsocephalus gunnari TaxID=52237 RepID=A0AAN8HJ21_CHAGU|nr:hypothetical protein CgunFtcFv8_008572 [Champsocephalus gunnari]